MKCLIFDADFTLYKIRNLKEAEEKKFIYLEEETGIDVNKLRNKWLSLVRELVDKGERNYIKRSREYSTTQALLYFGADEKTSETLTKEALEIFWNSVVENLKFNPEIKEVMMKLKNKYKLCVASDEFRKSLEMKLNKVFGNWKDYFEFLVTADDTRELKPSKRFCEIPLEKFGVEPNQAVFIGDSWERELAVAKKMGLKTVLVNERREGEPDYWIKEIKDASCIEF